MAKGYLKIENDLFEFLYSGNLEHSELRVLLFLLRYTKGFNRNTCRASIRYIAKGTGLCENSVRRAINNLISGKYISVEYENKGPAARIFKLLLQKNEVLPPHRMSCNGTNKCSANGTNECTQDIKEDIKDKDIKEKKENPSDSDEDRPLTDEEYDALWKDVLGGDE